MQATAGPGRGRDPMLMSVEDHTLVRRGWDHRIWRRPDVVGWMGEGRESSRCPATPSERQGVFETCWDNC